MECSECNCGTEDGRRENSDDRNNVLQCSHLFPVRNQTKRKTDDGPQCTDPNRSASGHTVQFLDQGNKHFDSWHDLSDQNEQRSRHGNDAEDCKNGILHTRRKAFKPVCKPLNGRDKRFLNEDNYPFNNGCERLPELCCGVLHGRIQAIERVVQFGKRRRLVPRQRRHRLELCIPFGKIFRTCIDVRQELRGDPVPEDLIGIRRLQRAVLNFRKCLDDAVEHLFIGAELPRGDAERVERLRRRIGCSCGKVRHCRAGAYQSPCKSRRIDACLQCKIVPSLYRFGGYVELLRHVVDLGARCSRAFSDRCCPCNDSGRPGR